tara:strand:- start:24 stop:275 length:252 start_codon:yes stop_codon:yes gene_type:complete
MNTGDEAMKEAARAVHERQQVPVMDQEDACRQSDEYIIRSMKTREDALCKEVASLTKKNLALKEQVRTLHEAMSLKLLSGDDA